MESVFQHVFIQKNINVIVSIITIRWSFRCIRVWSYQKTVVTTRSVQFMPFWLSFFLFLNGAIWGVYALLLHDMFLLVSIILV